MSDTAPRHLAFILDGNRRWATENKHPKMEGHRRGHDNLKTIAEAAFNSGVEFITAYIFSTENWNRSKYEVSYLMKLALKIFEEDLKEMHEKGIRVMWLGTRERLSRQHNKAIDEAVELTKSNTKGTLGICFNYGGRQEIVDACNKVAQSGVAEVTEATLAENLYSPDIPDIDLLVRTSGEMRISNFMLWRAAYAELMFIEKHWPAFTTDDLKEVIQEFNQRQRRFGA